MNSSDPAVNKVREETEQGRLDLLRSDTDLIHTLIDLAEAEIKMKNREHAVETLGRAAKGYGDVCRIFEQRNSWKPKATQEIKSKLAGIRQELDRLQQLIHPGEPAPDIP